MFEHTYSLPIEVACRVSMIMLGLFWLHNFCMGSTYDGPTWLN